jgi:hypothetical protein
MVDFVSDAAADWFNTLYGSKDVREGLARWSKAYGPEWEDIVRAVEDETGVGFADGWSRYWATTPPAKAVCFDGQSLNNYPVGNTFPEWAMASRGVPFRVVAIDGHTWETLTPSVEDRLHPKIDMATSVGLVLSAGTTALALNQSGAALYTATVAYADAARAAGFAWVVGTTVPENSFFTGAQETQRQAFNTAVLADAEAAFEDVADVAAALTPWATYTSDGTHYNALGAFTAAGVLDPILDTLLA